MIIRRANENEIEYAAKYACQLNSNPQHKCKAFPVDYTDITKQFIQILHHSDDELLVAMDGEALCGLLTLCVEPDEKYLEAVGGVFAHRNYNAVAKEFYEYLKNNYNGYQFDAAYPEENKQATEFMNSIGAKLLAFEYELRIGKNKYKEQEKSPNVIKLSEEYYESFAKIHDRLHPDVYWTSERLLKALDRFDIFVVTENNEVIGSVVTSSFSGKLEEIYFIEVAGSRQNCGFGTALLNQALWQAFHKGAEELMVMADKDDKAALHLFEKFGFVKTDTCLTYSVKLS